MYDVIGFEGDVMGFEGLDTVVAGVVLIVLAVILAAALVCGVLTAMALFRLAKRREIDNPWLAWVPIGQGWILGSLSDQYQYVSWRKVQSRRKILLGLGIAQIAAPVLFLCISLYVRYVVAPGDLLYAAIHLATYRTLLLKGVTNVLAVVSMVYQYICLYNLFRSCNPRNASGFLVLSILVPVTEPFLLLSNRNRDWGMPPRQDQAPEGDWNRQSPDHHVRYEQPQQPPENFSWHNDRRPPV